MSIADSSERKLNIIGPKGLLHFIAAMRLYAYRYIYFPAILVVAR